MIEEIFSVVLEYGLETVLIALAINFATTIIKLPIKALSKKLTNSEKLTRFIVFIPVGLGFLFSYIYAKFIIQNYIFDKTFITLWITSSSLSLTFYAIFEKFFPKKKRVITDEETSVAQEIIEQVKVVSEQVVETTEAKEMETKIEPKKIILGGAHSEKVETQAE